MGNDKNNTSKVGVFFSTVIPYVIAVIILVAYAWFLKYLLTKTQVDENEWMKLVYLFGSLEAIVFTAVGFIFGKEVNRSRALKAEKEAENSKKEGNSLAMNILRNTSKGKNHSAKNISDLRTLAEKFLEG